jgi:hypothetical protein
MQEKSILNKLLRSSCLVTSRHDKTQWGGGGGKTLYTSKLYNLFSICKNIPQPPFIKNLSCFSVFVPCHIHDAEILFCF